MEEEVINVFSEIGKLKTVLLHRPGTELENLTPDSMIHLLFDDIPYLKVAQEEHDAFSKALKDNGTEVLYIEKLAAETLAVSKDIKEEFIKQFLNETNIHKGYLFDTLFDYLNSFNEQDLVNNLIAGIRTKDIKLSHKSLNTMAGGEDNFYCDPMPNILFTRDNFASMGKGATLNTMYSATRNRECIFHEYLFKYHPKFKNTPLYYNRFEGHCIEGGDELILSKDTLAIGISQRTHGGAIEKLAHKLFNSDSGFKKILAFNIPKKRAFMHLDTVFTQVDKDKFTIHPEAEAALEVFTITSKDKGISITSEQNTLESVLSHSLDEKVKLLKCGNGDPVDAAREQWNDGSNTLAIAPGKVIVYSRNHVTNKLLRDQGLNVIEMPSSELSRGRGGPRCMSMPIIREDV